MKMILDMDTGVDDTMAIAYSLGCPDIDLIGVTCSFGNVTVERAARNTLDVLHLFGADDVPVFAGEAKALIKDVVYHPEESTQKVHGVNGVGEVQLPVAPRRLEGQPAAQFIVESARKYGKDLALVPTAGLRNIADAIKLDKEAMAGIGSITIMGGSLSGGNHTPYAEANFYVDSAAAKYVVESGIPLQLVGLDITLKTFMSESDITSWKSKGTEAAKALYDMSCYYYLNEYSDGRLSGAVHDPLAVDAAVHPDVVTDFDMCQMTVVVGGERDGELLVKTSVKDGADPEKCNVRYGFDIDADGFMKRFVKTVEDVL